MLNADALSAVLTSSTGVTTTAEGDFAGERIPKAPCVEATTTTFVRNPLEVSIPYDPIVTQETSCGTYIVAKEPISTDILTAVDVAGLSDTTTAVVPLTGVKQALKITPTPNLARKERRV